jgi:hypothetical protein
VGEAVGGFAPGRRAGQRAGRDGAIPESISSDFNGLRRHFRSAWTRLRNGPNEALISPGETKRFAAHALSRWNRYERRIRHFAELFVFNGLTSFSFRRFHGLFVFTDLAPLSVSPRNSQRRLDLAPKPDRGRPRSQAWLAIEF